MLINFTGLIGSKTMKASAEETTTKTLLGDLKLDYHFNLGHPSFNAKPFFSLPSSLFDCTLSE